MTEFICEFCKRILSSKASLNYHKKTAKICLSLQNKESNFSCKECGKSFNDNRNLSQHMEKCKGKQNDEKNYIVKIACLEKEIENCNKIIEEKNSIIEKLQNQIHEIALKSSLKTNSTNTTTNQNIINLIPLKKEYLKEQANNFNETYFQDGVYGYANFAANFSFKDRVKCTDLARNMFLYINEDGLKVKEKGEHLAKMFFQSIHEKNTEIFNKQKDVLFSLIETANKSDTEELLKLMEFYRENTIGVNRITNGIDDKLRQDFIRELGSKLLKLKN